MSDSTSKLAAHRSVLDSEASHSLAVPRPSAWSVPLLHSQTADSTKPPNISFNGRDEKIGGRVEKIGNLHSEASVSLTVPRPSAWSVPLLHSQTADSTKPPNISFNGRDEKIGGRVEKIGKQPLSSRKSI